MIPDDLMIYKYSLKLFIFHLVYFCRVYLEEDDNGNDNISLLAYLDYEIRKSYLH